MAKTAPTPPAPRTTERTRWGAGLLLLGSLLAMGTLTAYLSRPGFWAATAPERLAALAANPAGLQVEGYLGIAAYLLLALAGLFLVSRETGSRLAGPGSPFWLPVAVGAGLLVAVEAFVAVGMAPLAAGAAAAPLVVAVLLGVLVLLAGIGVVAMAAGFGFVMWSESQTARPAVSPALLYAGMLGSAGTVVGGLAFITGVRSLLVGFYLTYLAYLVLLLMATNIAFPGVLGAPRAAAESSEA